MLSSLKLVEIFVQADNFLKIFDQITQHCLLGQVHKLH